jgi:hypothetical protein
MAFLTVEKGPDKDLGKKFPLGENAVIIGRGTTGNNLDITLHDEYVSRHHAEISFQGNCFRLRDLSSTNGTSLDEMRIASDKFYVLKQDAIIGLGITSSGARVALRFKESPTVSTTRLDVLVPKEGSSPSWLKLDAEKGEIWVDQKLLILPRKEFDLLVCLYRRAGKACHRDDLIREVWPEVIDLGGVSDAAIDQLVHRIRAKIEPNPSRPARLISRKGFGYRLI